MIIPSANCGNSVPNIVKLSSSSDIIIIQKIYLLENENKYKNPNAKIYGKSDVYKNV